MFCLNDNTYLCVVNCSKQDASQALMGRPICSAHAASPRVRRREQHPAVGVHLGALDRNGRNEIGHTREERQRYPRGHVSDERAGILGVATGASCIR